MKPRITLLFIILCLTIIMNGCHPKENNEINEKQEKESESKLIPVIMNDPRVNVPWTKIREVKVDLDSDSKEESLGLYTTAERDKKGNLMWDDGQKWLLFAQNEKKYYVLFSEYVQLGSVYFTVSKYSNDEIPKVTVIVSTGANLKLKNYSYDKDKQGYKEESIYDSQVINLLFTSIPNYN